MRSRSAGDAAADQVVAHRVRAPIAQRQVVFRRADVAGVPFDLDPQRRRRRAAPSPLRPARASLPAAASSGRSRSARPRTCRSSTGGRVTWMLTVSDAVLLSVGQVTVTVTGTAAVLLRRRPQRLPLGRIRKRPARRRPPIRHRAADRIGRRRRHRRALARPPPCTDRTPPSPSGCAPAARRRRRGRRRRRRRHIHPHARVIADPHLPVPVIAERLVVGLPARAIALLPSARSSSGRRRRRSPCAPAHVSADRRPRQVLRVRGQRRHAAVGRRPAAPPVIVAVSLGRHEAVQFARHAAAGCATGKPTPAPHRNAPPACRSRPARRGTRSRA